MQTPVPVDLVLFLAAVAAFFLVGLPLITRRVSVPRSFVIESAARTTGLAPSACITAALALLMTASAAVVGWLCVGKAFIWGFLLSYAVLRLAGPLGAGTVLAISACTGAVASWAAGVRERRMALA